jgi:hypothetical protein
MDSLVRLGGLQKAGDYVRIGGDHPFVRAGLQLLFHKSCSKMHGLPCRGLAASIGGCNMKNGTGKPRSGWIKKLLNTPTHCWVCPTTFGLQTFL